MDTLLLIWLHLQVIHSGEKRKKRERGKRLLFPFSVFVYCSGLLSLCLCHFCRFGFMRNPHLILDAKPKVGQREVTLSYVTDWIEKKLCEVVEVRTLYPVHACLLEMVGKTVILISTVKCIKLEVITDGS